MRCRVVGERGSMRVFDSQDGLREFGQWHHVIDRNHLVLIDRDWMASTR